MSDKKLLKVTIQTTEKIMFEGPAERLTSFNEMGKFDVYPMHANFISIIGQELVIYHDKQKVKEMQFEQAVLKVKQDQVDIFLGIEVLQLDK
jgi:F0F1-type ATP synthase epsilon subunit